MESLTFNILKLSPSSIFDLERLGLFYLVHNLVLYNGTIRQQAIPQLVTRFMGKCKQKKTKNVLITKKNILFLVFSDTNLIKMDPTFLEHLILNKTKQIPCL